METKAENREIGQVIVSFALIVIVFLIASFIEAHEYIFY